MRTVMCILNGQLRPVVVRDRSIASDVPAAEKADRSNPDHVAAPFAGVVTVSGRRRRQGRRRTDHRHHRGDEDGGRDHRAQGGHRQPHRRIGHRAGRGWRSAGGGELTRIVAGTLGGRRIAVPRTGTRPDYRPGARVAVQRARVAHRLRRRLGARPVRGFGRAWPGGAVEGRHVGGVRRIRPSRGRRHRPEHRVAGGDGAPCGAGLSQRCWRAARTGRSTWCFADPPYDVGDAEIVQMLTALVDGGWVRSGQRRGRRAGGVGAVADVAGRLAAVAGPPLRRHPAGAGRAEPELP